jgi:hypothetical protein
MWHVPSVPVAAAAAAARVQFNGFACEFFISFFRIIFLNLVAAIWTCGIEIFARSLARLLVGCLDNLASQLQFMG